MRRLFKTRRRIGQLKVGRDGKRRRAEREKPAGA